MWVWSVLFVYAVGRMLAYACSLQHALWVWDAPGHACGVCFAEFHSFHHASCPNSTSNALGVLHTCPVSRQLIPPHSLTVLASMLAMPLSAGLFCMPADTTSPLQVAEKLMQPEQQLPLMASDSMVPLRDHAVARHFVLVQDTMCMDDGRWGRMGCRIGRWGRMGCRIGRWGWMGSDAG